MTHMTLPSLVPVLPELVLAVLIMALLMFGVFRGDSSTRAVSWLSIIAMVVTIVLVGMGPAEKTIAMNDMFVTDGFARVFKTLVLIGSSIALILSFSYNRDHQMERFEYPILILLGTLGMMLMISANDLMSLYVGLELQSLSLYVIAAFRRDDTRSTEAGLKYFVLGAVSSGMLLYGSSLIYGFSGSTNFAGIAKALVGVPHAQVSIGLITGMIFLVAGLAFKVAAVPFHMWSPDVYEGVPTPVTAFFAAAPKVAAVALFLRAMLSPFGDLVTDWRQVIIFISVASMLLGSFAAINQRNIKRLMAYSSIGHVGFALLGLAAGTQEGVRGVVVYMTIYMVMTLGTFACILAMKRENGMVETIDDLAGLGRTHPAMALAMGIFMFSLAGIPPLAGFFAKFYVFMAAVNSGLYMLAVIGMLASCVGAFYYLRVVKVMYFDQPVGAFAPIRGELALVFGATGLFTLFFFVYPAPIMAAAETAARALLP